MLEIETLSFSIWISVSARRRKHLKVEFINRKTFSNVQELLTVLNSFSNLVRISSMQMILLYNALSTLSACVLRSRAEFIRIASKVPRSSIDS